jgi:hypothetical protein
MPLFVLFVFGAVVFGAGAMLAPAWPTRQPRVFLNAALAIGVVIGGALFWAMLFGWSTLVVDYLLFALVTSIFLFGTLSYGQKRAEARGEELADADQGWPGPRDLMFFAAAALVLIVPVLILPVPLDTDAQGFGYLGLMARLGGTFDTLAPFHPQIEYLYAPGFTALIAYLSHQLGQGMHHVQLAVAAVFALLLIGLAYDFGSEIRDKRLGRAMAAAMCIGVGMFTSYMDSHYTTLIALCFAFAFLLYIFRYLREEKLADLIGAGLMLGAVVICHPDTTIILALGYGPFLLAVWLPRERPRLRVWLVLVFVVPALALAAIAPWLLSLIPLLGSEIVSPFVRNPNYWRLMVIYHGVLIVPIAALGAFAVLWGRRAPAAGAPARYHIDDVRAVLLSLGWLLFAFDFAITGVTEQVLGPLLGPLFRYDYPFSIAWHAPIIPYTILGGYGLLWLADRAPGGLRAWARRFAPAGFAAAGAAAVVVIFAWQPILIATKDFVSFFGAFSSHADVAAMNWLRANTPTDARILNHPGPHEADWVPVVSERDSVYYRPQPFFRGAEGSLAEQERFRAFWENPADPAHRALLAEGGVDYVIVPQIVTDPASIRAMFRWRAPFTESLPMQSSPADAPYLRLVFDQEGAQVYEVTAP